MLQSEPYLIDNSKSGEYEMLEIETNSVECDVEYQDNFNLKAGNSDMICQLDGNESVEESLDGYDTDDDMDSEPIRAVLVPAQPQAGQPFSLEVGNDRVQAPSSLPLAMIANFRSAYNKAKNIKQNLTTLGLDILIASETWERPNFLLPVCQSLTFLGQAVSQISLAFKFLASESLVCYRSVVPNGRPINLLNTKHVLLLLNR